MNNLPEPAAAAQARTAAAGASLEASDDLLAPPRSPRYCPTGLLASFALLMAGHGRCVNTDMMLGDRRVRDVAAGLRTSDGRR
jgi:hypothetical protein